MSHPIVEKVIQEGVQSVDLSMVSKELRNRLMTEAGVTLLHKGRYAEAAKALEIADNKEMLREQGEWFLKQKRPAMAAWFMIPIADEHVLLDLAQECVAIGEIASARAIYEKLGDTTMLEFLNQNFYNN